jgi:putative glutamine amidotransferase
VIGICAVRERARLVPEAPALGRELPVLAICRGMQLLNVALGGTLEQSLIAADGSNPHRKVIGTFDGTEHAVRLQPGSLAAQAVGEALDIARCHHHQSAPAMVNWLKGPHLTPSWATAQNHPATLGGA